VWLVDLTAGGGTPDVAAEMARTLDVRTPRGTTPTAALRRYLVSRDLLLVLDNCEHVVDAAAELAADLLGSCVGVRILAANPGTDDHDPRHQPAVAARDGMALELGDALARQSRSIERISAG
jgi:predicted ATPase